MDTDQIFNLEEALSRVDGDRELLADLINMFLEESPKELASVRAAQARQDAAGLASAAHKLKGSVMQFCAQPLFESVKRLEVLGRAGDLTAAAPLCATVETQLIELQNILRQARVSDQGA